MNGRSDEYDEMTDHADVPGTPPAGNQFEQDEVARFLVELRMLGQGQPPSPSPQLAALLGGATLLQPRQERRRAYRVAARSALVAATVVAGLVVAAAKHDLPKPAQRVVSDVVNVLTPFEITPEQNVTPTPTPQPRPAVAPPGDDSSEPGDQRPGGGDASDDRTRSRGSDDGAGTGGGGADDGAGTVGGADDGAGSVGGGGSDDGGATSAPRTGGEREDR